jgi:hypothetical protein
MAPFSVRHGGGFNDVTPACRGASPEDDGQLDSPSKNPGGRGTSRRARGLTSSNVHAAQTWLHHRLIFWAWLPSSEHRAHGRCAAANQIAALATPSTTGSAGIT